MGVVALNMNAKSEEAQKKASSRAVAVGDGRGYALGGCERSGLSSFLFFVSDLPFIRPGRRQIWIC